MGWSKLRFENDLCILRSNKGQGHVQNAGLAQNQSHGLEKDQERPGNGRLEDQGKINL